QLQPRQPTRLPQKSRRLNHHRPPAQALVSTNVEANSRRPITNFTSSGRRDPSPKDRTNPSKAATPDPAGPPPDDGRTCANESVNPDSDRDRKSTRLNSSHVSI